MAGALEGCLDGAMQGGVVAGLDRVAEQQQHPHRRTVRRASARVSGPSSPNSGSAGGSGTAAMLVEHVRPLSFLARAEIPVRPGRIGADHEKVVARAEVLVADAGRDDHHVAGPNGHHHAPGAAEPHARLAAADRQDLVRGAVIVRERVDAVAPGAAPAIGGEHRLAGRRDVAAACVERARIDQERQAWVVGDRAVVVEQVARRLDGVDALGRHRLVPTSLPSLRHLPPAAYAMAAGGDRLRRRRGR